MNIKYLIVIIQYIGSILHNDFNFIYVNDSIYIKTKYYFNENVFKCDCDNNSDCSDPKVCPCAHKNYLSSHKTKCYIRKGNTEDDTIKILNPEGLNDEPIFKCHPDCKCNKYKCSNSCLNIPNLNPVYPLKHFIVQRYKKIYGGVNTNLNGNTGIMWGFKNHEIAAALFLCYGIHRRNNHKARSRSKTKTNDAVHSNYLFDLNKDIEVIKVDNTKDELWISVDGKFEIRSMSQKSALETIFLYVLMDINMEI